MRRHSMVSSIVSLGLLLGMADYSSLQAQDRGQFTDFRGRSDYTEEELARSLFGQTSSDVRTRGIGPAQSQTPKPTGNPDKQAVALNVFFEFNSDKILQGYYGDLDKLGKVLTAPEYSVYRIQVEGYTDSVGSDSYNQRLSQRRAESVKRYLVQRFPIPVDRLVVKGLGKSNPIASNDTPEGRDKNRRVEVVNLGTN